MDEGKMQRTIAWCICCALWLVAMFIAGWLAIRFGAANVTGPDGEPWTMDAVGVIAGTRRAHKIALSTMRSVSSK